MSGNPWARFVQGLPDNPQTRYPRPYGYPSGAWQSTSSSTWQMLFKVLSDSGGGGGCTCDWNNVPFITLKGHMVLDAVATPPDPNQVIEIRNDPYEFKDWNSGQYGSIVAFLRANLSSQIGHNWDIPKSAAIKFTSLKPNLLDGGLYSAFLSLVNFSANDPGVGIVCSHHLVVRKDFLLNGMINCVEGAIVLHAGPYRQWNNAPQNPTIYTSEANYHQVDFLKFGTTTDFVPIRCGGLRDSNGSLGVNGQVLTSNSSGLLWQNAGSVTQRIEKGQVQTNSSGDDVVVNFSPAFTSQPIITTGMLDASGRALSVTITSLSGQPQNDLRAGFRIRTTTAALTNGDHYHDNGTRFLYTEKTTTTNSVPNVANSGHYHTYSDWYFEQVNGYDMQQGVNRRGYTSNSNVSTSIARPAQTTIHWIAIGT